MVFMTMTVSGITSLMGLRLIRIHVTLGLMLCHVGTYICRFYKEEVWGKGDMQPMMGCVCGC